MKRLLITLAIGGLLQGLYAQEYEPVVQEDSLFSLFSKFRLKETKEERSALNKSIIAYMKEVLSDPASLEYRFDRLRKMVGILDSGDGLFRVFTWNVPLDAFQHEYYGIIQVRHQGNCTVHYLENRTNEIDNILHSETGKDAWPGALYYELRRNKRGKEVNYTLLGYNFHDRWSDKKIIDILHLDENMEPRFGKAIFHTPEGIQHRVIFEYSGNVAMNLRYNPDLKMIVYDHLSPLEPELAGHFRFYAPDFSYDGYRFRKGIWEHQSNLDVRNR